MKYDKFGTAYCTELELADMLYKDPTLDISRFQVENPETYNSSVSSLYADMKLLEKYVPNNSIDVEEFDRKNQSSWFMPREYQDLDIAQWVLDQCKHQSELQRAGEELLLFQERDMFELLKFMKYMVDTFRKNNVVWGVGRGSSVASFVLYLIGVHKINSLYYELPIEEFLK